MKFWDNVGDNYISGGLISKYVSKKYLFAHNMASNTEKFLLHTSGAPKASRGEV